MKYGKALILAAIVLVVAGCSSIPEVKRQECTDLLSKEATRVEYEIMKIRNDGNSNIDSIFNPKTFSQGKSTALFSRGIFNAFFNEVFREQLTQLSSLPGEYRKLALSGTYPKGCENPNKIYALSNNSINSYSEMWAVVVQTAQAIADSGGKFEGDSIDKLVNQLKGKVNK